MDKGTILNQVVAQAASLMEWKIDMLECIADQYEEKGDLVRAEKWREDIPAIRSAVEVMRKLAGGWA